MTYQIAWQIYITLDCVDANWYYLEINMKM